VLTQSNYLRGSRATNWPRIHFELSPWRRSGTTVADRHPGSRTMRFATPHELWSTRKS